MTLLNQYGNPYIYATDAGPSRGRGTVSPRHPRLVNNVTGMGGATDKDIGSAFYAYRMAREEAEQLYAMSWAAAKMVDIPIDDMFWRGRRFTGDDQGAIDAFQEAEHELGLMTALPNAMKAGQIFGTGLMVLCPLEPSGDGDMDKPFTPDNVKEGGLANLWVVDRWACSVQNWQTSPFLPRYGEVYQYRVNARIFGSPDPLMTGPPGVSSLSASGSHIVNRDHAFRFDGMRSPLTEGWTSGPWEREWGVSLFTKAIDAIARHASAHANAGQLLNEASIWVQKVQGFKQGIRGRPIPGEATIDELAVEQSMLRSNYRTQFMDAEDEAERIAVAFAGIPDLLDKFQEILAVIAGVPMTRWNEQSPAGMNATGKSDANNWALTVAAMQTRRLDPVLKRLDPFIARHAGLREAPEYEWIPLTDVTEKEQAEIDKLNTETLNLGLTGGWTDEDEVRERASQIELWGELAANWEPPVDEMEQAQQEMDADLNAARIKQMANGNGNGGPPRN